MKKIMKSVLLGLLVTLLTVGVVYAAYTVWSGRTTTTVQEPLETSLITKLPEATYPNQEYETKIKVHNVNVDGNGDQKVGVTVTKSNDLVYQNICWNTGSDWNCQSGDVWHNTLLNFTVAKDGNVWVKANVKVRSDATPENEWVNFEVTRE